VRIGQDEVKIFIETFLRFGWGKPAVYPRLPRGLGVIIQVENSILKNLTDEELEVLLELFS